jgi:hypothetical protein
MKVSEKRREESWIEIERPIGRQPVPAWCKDVHIQWMDGFGNSPTFNLKTDGTDGDWPGKCFSYKNGVYTAKHEDGRLEQHAHDGAVSWGKVRMFRSSLTGLVTQHRPSCRIDDNPGGMSWTYPDGRTETHAPGEWEDVDHLVTTQQQGYAGRHFRILRDDGRYVMLRGPWHIGEPDGYHGVTTTDCSKPDLWIQKNGFKWWRRTGCFGLFLRSDVLINIISRYQPHVRLAAVTRSYGGPYLEPIKPEWEAPKGFARQASTLAKERESA